MALGARGAGKEKGSAWIEDMQCKMLSFPTLELLVEEGICRAQESYSVLPCAKCYPQK